MTPTADVETDSSGLDSAMDTFFSPPAAPAGGADGSPPPAGDEAQPEAEEQAAPEAEPEPEAAAPAEEEPAATAAEEEPAAQPVIPPGKMMVEKARWENVYRGHKFAQEVRSFAPDVQTARSHYERFNDLRHMHADFTSDAADENSKFIEYWRSENPQAFDRLVPQALEAASPEVRATISNQALSTQRDDLYAHAAETQDPQDLYKAQMFEWSLTGSYRTKDQIPKVDPLARRATELDERETRLKTDEQRRAEGVRTEWTQRTDAAIASKVDEGIDQMLAPVQARFAKAPDLFKALRSQVRTQIFQAVKADREWSRTFQLDYKAAMRVMSPAERSALVQSYMQRATPLLAATAKPLIDQATAILVSTNQGVHNRLANGAGKGGPNAPGKPTPQSIKAQRPRTDMTLEEKIDADMDVGLRP